MHKERNSSFELLRIISILLIIMHHYAVHGGFDFYRESSWRLCFVQCLGMGGKIGVNLFVLISGYFLCKSNVNFTKIVKLELEVIFYCIAIGIVFHLFFPETESLKDLFLELTPLRSKRYWFYNTYIVLVLLCPFINKLIDSLEKKEFRKLLILLFVLWCFIPTIPKFGALEFSCLGWFVFLYCCAAYFRIYSDDLPFKAKSYILCGLGFYILLLLSVLPFVFFFDGKYRNKFDYFLPMNSILVFACSIAFFLGFLKLDFGCKRWINFISSTTFGVYLIHSNHLVSPFLWNDLLENSKFLNTDKLYLHAFCSVVLVYFCCVFIDLVRKYAFEKPFFRLVEKIRGRCNSLNE